jgi:hypothetical protein
MTFRSFNLFLVFQIKNGCGVGKAKSIPVKEMAILNSSGQIHKLFNNSALPLLIEPS